MNIENTNLIVCFYPLHPFSSEVSGHLEIMQDELESLKDLLRSDVYSLDHNTLLGVSSLPIINGQDEANLLTAGSKQNLNIEKIANPTNVYSNNMISNANGEDCNNVGGQEEDIDQTRYKILQFLNESIFNDLD